VQTGLSAIFGHLILVCKKYPESSYFKRDIIGKQRWEQIEVSDGPSPRYGHAIEVAPDQQSMFVVGGYNKVKHFDDIYQFHFGESLPLAKRTNPNITTYYNPADRKWTQWQVAGSAPGGSCYQSISFVDGRNLISFGGRDVNSDSYNDVKTGTHLPKC